MQFEAGRPRNRSSIPDMDTELLHSVQSLWGPPSLLSNGYRRALPGGKTAKARGWPLISTSVEVKNLWSYTPILPYLFMLWCLIN
jgi:hypothetical protein